MKYFVCISLFLLTTYAGAQVKPAPLTYQEPKARDTTPVSVTVTQCRADQRRWFSRVSDPHDPLTAYNIHTLEGWKTTMRDCQTIDSNTLKYLDYDLTLQLVDMRITERYQRFLRRHNLLDQFEEEDAAGKR